MVATLRLMERWAAFLPIFLTLFTLHVQGAPQGDLDVLHQIYTADEPVTIATREGYNYLHVEGDDPDWSLGILRTISHRSQSITGDGEVHTFQSISGGRYHYVEERRLEGVVRLVPSGTVKPFSYTIRQDDLVVKVGHVTAAEAAAGPTVSLLYGDYTFEAAAEGYACGAPQKFSLGPDTQIAEVDVKICPKSAVVRVLAHPHGVANGLNVEFVPADTATENTGPILVTIGGHGTEVPAGLYNVRFPDVEGHNSPGNGRGIIGHVRLEPGKKVQDVVGEYAPNVGTIEISYGSDPEFANKLPEVIYTLLDREGQQWGNGVAKLQPKTGRFVAEIDNLPTGNYRLNFDVPQYVFATPEQRTIRVNGGLTSLVDIDLKPQLGGLEVTTESIGSQFKTLPSIRIEAEDGSVVGTATGDFSSKKLQPGQYRIFFGDVADRSTPPAAYAEVHPGRVTGPIVGEYTKADGSLQITWTTGPSKKRLDDIRLWVSDGKGRRRQFPQDDTFTTPTPTSRRVTITDLPVGSYLVEWDLPNKDGFFTDVATKYVEVRKGEMTELQQTFSPRFGGVHVSARVPGEVSALKSDVRISLENANHEIVETTLGGKLLVNDLEPGNYTVVYSDVDGLVTPTMRNINVIPEKISGPFYADYHRAVGGLVVRYTCGPKAERLSRVRFWLTDSTGKRQMFPKTSGDGSLKIVETAGEITQGEVTIEDLPEDRYILEWLVPNADGLFPEMSARDVYVTTGERAVVEQAMQPRYSSVAAVAQPSETQPFREEPMVSLVNEQGHIVSNDAGKLNARLLIPGTYQLVFGDVDGYETPDPITVRLGPGQTLDTFVGEYQFQGGELMVVFHTDAPPSRLQDIGFTLKDKEGNSWRCPEQAELVEDPVTGGRKAKLSNLRPGTYQLEFDIPNDDGFFHPISSQEIVLQSGRTTYLRQALEPRYGSVIITAKIPGADGEEGPRPEIILKDNFGRIAGRSLDGSLDVDNLLPGDYVATFGSITDCVEPTPLKIRVFANQEAGPFDVTYARGTGTAVVSFSTGPEKELLPNVTCTIVDATTQAVVATKAGKDAEDGSVSFEELPCGNYYAELNVVDDNGLFPETVRKSLTVRQGETTWVAAQMRPQYGGIEADVLFTGDEETPERPPVITLRALNGKRQGQTVALARDGHLRAMDLSPGRYELVYGHVDGFVTPDPVTIEVAASHIAGPYEGRYIVGDGRLEIRYGTGPEASFLDDVRFWITDREGRRTLYPLEGEYTDDPATGIRTVAVENLKAGNYTLGFSTPDQNGLFPEISPKELQVYSGETTSWTQEILPRWCSVELTAQAEADHRGHVPTPQVTLRNPYGAVAARSTQGVLTVDGLIPGSYRVVYENLDGYAAPKPQMIQLTAGKRAALPAATYVPELGALAVAYNLPTKPELLDSVSFTVTDEYGRSRRFPEENIPDVPSLEHETIIEDMPVGTYTITFDYGDNALAFAPLPPQRVRISGGARERVAIKLPLRLGGCTAQLQAPDDDGSPLPLLVLKDAEGAIAARGELGTVSADELLPGNYTLEIGPSDSFEAIPPLPVSVVGNEISGPHLVKLARCYGSMAITYAVNGKAQYLEGVRFWLIDEKGNRTLHPTEKELKIADNGYTATISDLETGEYTVEFLLPEAEGLFGEVAPRTVPVVRNRQTAAQVDLPVNYGTFHATASVPEGFSQPRLTLTDSAGVLVAAERTLLTMEDLAPGEYTLTYSDVDGLKTPESQTFTVRPNARSGPFLGLYTPSTGVLSVSYATDEVGNDLDAIGFWLIQPSGERERYPQPGAFRDNGNSRQVMVSDLLPGDYKIEFILPDSGTFGAGATISATVAAGELSKVFQQFNAQYGRLHVAYSTDADNTRIDRIRFWVIDSAGNRKMYPRDEDEAIENDHGREVMIDGLLAGEYRIQFLLPNADGLFLPPTIADIKIGAGETAELERRFMPNFATVYARAQVPPGFEQEAALLSIQLTTPSGEMVPTKLRDDGSLVADSLTPGEYVVTFDDDPRLEAPDPVTVHVEPGEVMGPIIGDYRQANGVLMVTMTSESHFDLARDITFKITDAQGVSRTYPRSSDTIDGESQRQVIISDLPVGSYTIEFDTAAAGGLFAPVPMEQVVLSKSEPIRLPVHLEPRYGHVEVGLQFPDGKPPELQPSITLIDPFGTSLAFSESGSIKADDLLPGRYTITFGPLAGYETPESVEFSIAPNEVIDYISGTYVKLAGVLSCTIDAAGMPERLDGGHLVITSDGITSMRIPLDPSKGVEQQLERTLPYGRYTISLEIDNDDKLFGDLPQQEVVITGNSTVATELQLQPRWARVKIAAETPHGTPRDVPIELRNAQGALVAAARGVLDAEGLAPGKYTAVYGDCPNCVTPAPQELFVDAGDTLNARIARYQLGLSKLRIVYDTGPTAAYLDQIKILVADETGREQTFTLDGPAQESDRTAEIIIDDIPVGTYTVSFDLSDTDGLFAEIPPQEVQVSMTEPAELTQHLEPLWASVSAVVSMPRGPPQLKQDAQVTLTDRQGNVVHAAYHDAFEAKNLTPGRYKISFEQIDGYDAPAPVVVDLQPATAEQIEVGYLLKTGQVKVNYSTSEDQQYLDAISFVLKGTLGQTLRFPGDGESSADATINGVEVLFRDVPADTYILSWVMPEGDDLLPTLPDQELRVLQGQTHLVRQNIKLMYGGFEVIAKVPATKKGELPTPTITIYDAAGRKINRVHDDRAVVGELPPGKYRVVFGDLADLQTPASRDVEVLPGAVTDPIVGEYAPATGQLQISYNTGRTQERLDEVQVWITDEWGQRSIFPNDVVAATDKGINKILELKELPVGRYTIEYYAPNADSLFNLPPKRSFTVNNGRRTTLSETLEAHYGSIEMRVVVPTTFEHSAADKPWKLSEETFGPLRQLRNALTIGATHAQLPWPQVALHDAHGNKIAETRNQQFVFEQLLPGRYTLHFEDVPYLKALPPQEVVVTPGEMSGPHTANYQIATGSAKIAYSTGRLNERIDQVTVRITDADGNIVNGPTGAKALPDYDLNGRYIEVGNLPIGEYRVEIAAPNDDGLFDLPKPALVEIERGSTATVAKVLTPRYSAVDAAAAFKPQPRGEIVEPKIQLFDDSGNLVADSRDGIFHNDSLAPGQYTLAFGDVRSYNTPEPVTITVKPDENVGPLIGTYTQAHGSLTVTYDTGDTGERLDRVRFWLVDQFGRRVMYPKGSQVAKADDGLSRTVHIESLPVGNYSVEWILPNTDHLFDTPPPKTVEIDKDRDTELQQSHDPQFALLDVRYSIEGIDDCNKMSRILVKDSYGETKVETTQAHLTDARLAPGQYQIVFQELEGYVTPEPVDLTLLPRADEGPIMAHYMRNTVPLAVKTNDESKKWQIFKDGAAVHSDSGTVANVDIPPGNGYYVVAEKRPGYDCRISPEGTFAVSGEEKTVVDIEYVPQYGYIELEKPLPEGEMITVVLTPQQGGQAIRKSIYSHDGSVIWQSEGIPTGSYTVEFEVPDHFEQIAKQVLAIGSGETFNLDPDLVCKRRLDVSSNLEEARYILASLENGTEYSGHGNRYTFEQLMPGRYELRFSSPGKQEWVAPQPQEVVITRNDDAVVHGQYHKGASLVVSSNVDMFDVAIVGVDKGGNPNGWRRTERIDSRTKTLKLPEGRYRLEFASLKGSMANRYGANHPDPVEVILNASKPERVHGLYEANKGSLVVTSNLDNAAYTVRDISDAEGLVLGRFHGTHTVVPMTFTGKYEVTFDTLPNYKTPAPVIVDIKSGERKTVGGSYLPEQKVVAVIAGPTIVGDVFGEGADDEKPPRTVQLAEFQIAVYPVTNAQYAAWLNQAIRKGTVKYVADGRLKGQVHDDKGRLLFETRLADSNSQIVARTERGVTAFNTVEGKDHFPVVEVSWHGAQAYCQDNRCRLPTEAEWEKAAGMAVTHPTQPLRKFRYAIGQDSINKSMANFVDTYNKENSFAVRTTEVGFYNGINLLLTAKQQGEVQPALVDQQYGTRMAKSPYGCFDMAGNVREWVHDWYDPNSLKTLADLNPQGPGHGTKKVTKGGCFDSFAYELRVSARLPLAPETTDAYTGFRVVLVD